MSRHLKSLQPRVKPLGKPLPSIGSLNVTRIRGRWLQQIREAYLSEHPLCAHCSTEQRPVLATQLDHIVALANGGKDFDADGGKNRQGLCDDCHDVKTRADLGHAPTSGRG